MNLAFISNIKPRMHTMAYSLRNSAENKNPLKFNLTELARWNRRN